MLNSCGEIVQETENVLLNVMKASEGMESWLHSYLTSALKVSECSASRSGCPLNWGLLESIEKNYKGKVIPLQARCGPEGR